MKYHYRESQPYHLLLASRLAHEEELTPDKRATLILA